MRRLIGNSMMGGEGEESQESKGRVSVFERKHDKIIRSNRFLGGLWFRIDKIGVDLVADQSRL